MDSLEKLEKLESRVEELERLMPPPPIEQKFFDIRFSSIAKTVIGGCVAGGLLWAFALDNLIKLHQSSELHRIELEEKSEKQSKKLASFETREEFLNSESDALARQIELLREDRDKLATLVDRLTAEATSLKKQAIVAQQASKKPGGQDASEVIGIISDSLKLATEAATELSNVGESAPKQTVERHVAVVASVHQTDDLSATVKRLTEVFPKEDVVAFHPAGKSEWRAVTLGGVLKSAEEAEGNAARARAAGIVDAYTARFLSEPEPIKLE